MKKLLEEKIESIKEDLFEISTYIYNNPEDGFVEFKANKVLTDYLKRHGFNVDNKVAGLDTAFVATYCPTGIEYPVIDVLAEFDAIEIADDRLIHACGHNIIAVTGVGAGIALKDVMTKENIPGTIRVVGTPAEEGGGGKVIMQREGIFDNTDSMILLHPTTGVSKIAGRCKSSVSLKVVYKGKGAHAGSHREKGINAQDAGTICYSAIGMLRNQTKSDASIFPQYCNVGNAKGVIPDRLEMKISIRTDYPNDLNEILEKVKGCIQAGAIATGCEYEIEQTEIYEGRLLNTTFEKYLRKNFEMLGEPLMEGLVDDNGGEDFGNLTRIVPGIMPYPSLMTEKKISGHTEEYYRLCDTDRARYIIMIGAKAMAYTMMDLLLDNSIIDEAKKELEERLKQELS